MPFPPGPNLSGEGVCLPRFNPFFTQLDVVYAMANDALTNANTALSLLAISGISPGGVVGYVFHSDGLHRVPIRVAGTEGAYYIEFGTPENL